MKPNFTLHAFLKYRKAISALFFLLIIYHGQSSAQCWKQVEAGPLNVLAIKDDGTLWGWGFNVGGQLGMGNNSNQSIHSADEFVPLSPTGNFKQNQFGYVIIKDLLRLVNGSLHVQSVSGEGTRITVGCFLAD